MFWFPDTYGNYAQPGSFNFGMVPAQLGQPITAKYSAKVAQKCEKDGAFRPQVRQNGGRTRRIEQSKSGRSVAYSKGIGFSKTRARQRSRLSQHRDAQMRYAP